MSKPITPVEFDRLKLEEVPALVYETINSLLLSAKSVRGNLVVSLDDLETNINKLFSNTDDMMLMIDKALIQYRNNGWTVRKSGFDWDDPEPEVIFFNRV